MSTCNNNLRNLGIAFANYTSNEDNLYPRFPNGGLSWDDQISKFVGIPLSEEEKQQTPLQTLKNGHEIFLCPEDHVEGEAIRRTYSYNSWYNLGVGRNGDASGSWVIEPVKATAIEDPSETILLTEWSIARNLVGLLGYSAMAHNGDVDRISTLHGTDANFLFCDGHVDLLYSPKSKENNYHLWRRSK